MAAAKKRCPKGQTSVKSYKKKGGSKVSSFCRKKPSSKKKRKLSRAKPSSKRAKLSSKRAKLSSKGKRKLSKKKSVKKSSTKAKSPKRVKSPLSQRPERQRSRERSPQRTISKIKYVRRYIQEQVEAKAGVQDLSESDIQRIIKIYSKNLYNCIEPGFELKKYIGRGSNGVVYKVCTTEPPDTEDAEEFLATFGKNCRIIKIQPVDKKKNIEHEIHMQNIFHNYNLAPKIYRHCYFKSGKRLFSLIEMDSVIGVMDSLLQREETKEYLDDIFDKAVTLIERLCENKLTHGDFHWGNIGYNIDSQGNPEILLIDFSWSNNKGCNPRIEFIQALRTLSLSKINTSNERYLEDLFYEVYRSKYNPILEKSVDAYDKEWKKLMDQYEKSL